MSSVTSSYRGKVRQATAPSWYLHHQNLPPASWELQVPYSPSKLESPCYKRTWDRPQRRHHSNRPKETRHLRQRLSLLASRGHPRCAVSSFPVLPTPSLGPESWQDALLVLANVGQDLHAFCGASARPSSQVHPLVQPPPQRWMLRVAAFCRFSTTIVPSRSRTEICPTYMLEDMHLPDQTLSNTTGC